MINGAAVANILVQVKEDFNGLSWVSCVKLLENFIQIAVSIFRLWRSIPCLLVPWLLTSQEQHQAWYWLCRIDDIYSCPRVNFNCLGRQIQDMIPNMNLSFAGLQKHNSIYQELTLLNSLVIRLSWPTLLCLFVQVNLWRPDAFPH